MIGDHIDGDTGLERYAALIPAVECLDISGLNSGAFFRKKSLNAAFASRAINLEQGA
jgi:hypothetical protein